MKANANFNTSLFRNFDQSTAAITSNIMICHPIREPGTYSGVVLKEKREIGFFNLVCQESVNDMQADIDLYKINTSFKNQCECDDKNERNVFKVHPGGYVVFYSSFGEGGYQVLLSNQNNQSTAYNTSSLEKGDVVIALFMRPGDYEVNATNGQVCYVSVDMPERTEEYQKILAEAVNLTLNENEFNAKEIKIAPGQGLVITLETEATLNIKLIKPREIPDNLKNKKRTWENPKYRRP